MNKTVHNIHKSNSFLQYNSSLLFHFLECPFSKLLSDLSLLSMDSPEFILGFLLCFLSKVQSSSLQPEFHVDHSQQYPFPSSCCHHPKIFEADCRSFSALASPAFRFSDSLFNCSRFLTSSSCFFFCLWTSAADAACIFFASFFSISTCS